MNKISREFVKQDNQSGADDGEKLASTPAGKPPRPQLPAKPRNQGPRHSRFDDLSRLIGKAAATKLVENYGGRRINVPSVMPPRHSITQTIGPAKAKLLARAYGGTWLVVPVGPATFQKKKQDKALVLLAEGMIAKDVARKTGLSERTIQRLKAKIKKAD